MEYLTLKGCVRLSDDCQPAYLEKEILGKLESIKFCASETAILCGVRGNKLWIFGEGLVDLKEGNQVIEIIRALEKVCDDSLVLDVSRVLWELNISIGSYDVDYYEQSA